MKPRRRRSRTKAGADYRTCENCPRKFKPVREDQKFCSPPCRKEYHRYGGAPLKKLIESPRLRAFIADTVDARLKALGVTAILEAGGPQR